MSSTRGIETLLELHNQIISQDSGYWVKIEAWRVDRTPAMPHGIRYSLSLHEPYGRRILGFDNAHAITSPRRNKYAGRIVAYDHKHRSRSDRGVPFEFKDAYRLLADFFAEVDRVMQEEKK